MSMVTVPAVKAFRYGARSFQIGEPVVVEAAQAAALARKGLVSLVKGGQTYQTASMDPHADDSPSLETPRRRRSYRRRDMLAEQP